MIRLCLFIILSHSPAMASAQTVPFFLDLQEVNTPGLPALHSLAKAQSGDKWLFVAGRTDGLHSFFPNTAFSPDYANNNIYVVDTLTWQVWNSSLYNLSYDIRKSLQSVNTQFYHYGNTLYVMGGYGYDSITDVKRTFASLTALDVNGLISEIISGGNDLSSYVRQITDTVFAVTGGKLERIADKFYLVGGQDFSGKYTKLDTEFFKQRYMNSISTFDLIDDGLNLSIANFISNIDTVNFHRRDLNTAPWISGNNEQGFGLYGGVFQYDHDIPFFNPVYVTSGGITIDFSFEQKMNQYTCPVIPLFDSAMNDMYTIFIGGESFYDYDEVNSILEIDSLIPFINDISTLIHHADGSSEEVILPVTLPELGGSNTEFFPNEGIARYENGVFKLRSITSPTLLGYLYGGIVANTGNGGITNASNKVYRVFLEPNFASGISSSSIGQTVRLYPNPANDYTQVNIKLPYWEVREIAVFDALNHEVMRISPPSLRGKDLRIRIDTKNFPGGIYSVRVRTPTNLFTNRLVVIR